MAKRPPEVFDDDLVSELREILTSHSMGWSYDQPAPISEPFTRDWTLQSVGFDNGDKSRVICVFRAGSREVRAVIDARDFSNARGRMKRGRSLVFDLSILLEESILSYRPEDLPEGDVRIWPGPDEHGAENAPNESRSGWFDYAPLSGDRWPSSASKRSR